MIVITDTNIFYSVLIAPKGETAKILKDKNIQFLVPDYLLEEIREHLPEIAQYLGKTIKHIKKEFEVLIKDFEILSAENISKSNLTEAQGITESIDSDDAPFIAFHLQYKHKIWSLDRKLIDGLTAKGYGYFFITTQELKARLYKKGKS